MRNSCEKARESERKRIRLERKAVQMCTFTAVIDGWSTRYGDNEYGRHLFLRPYVCDMSDTILCCLSISVVTDSDRTIALTSDIRIERVVTMVQ